MNEQQITTDDQENTSVPLRDVVTNNVEALMEQALHYREQYDNAKTNLKKELYSKKLKKTVKHLDRYVRAINKFNTNTKSETFVESPLEQSDND